MTFEVRLAHVNYKIPSLELVFVRSFIQTLFALIHIVYVQKVNVLGPKKTRFLLTVRGLSGTISLSLLYYSLTVIPLADANTLFFTNTAMTSFLAWIILGEKISKLDFISSFACFIGVILVSRPYFLFHQNLSEEIRIVDLIATLVSALFCAIAFVCVRKITHIEKVDPMFHVLYMGFFSVIVSAFGPLIEGFIIPQTLNEYLLLISNGVLAFIGQVMLNKGLQLAPAGPGSLMRTLDIVLSFLLGFFIGETPQWTSYLGASLILIFTMVVGIYKNKSFFLKLYMKNGR
jgi:drug/metabolite transporter (DMT)-like permease